MLNPGLFRTEQIDDTLVVIALGSGSQIAEQRAQEESEAVLRQLQNPGVKNLLIDLESAGSLTTEMLGLMQRFRREVHALNGKMGLCNVPPAGREVLRFVQLDTLWPIHSSRDRALRDMKNPEGRSD